MQAKGGFRHFRGLKPGKRQARMPYQERAMCRQRAGCNAGTDGQELGGSCREGCAGKGQAATLEQQRLTARLGGSCREGIGGF